MPGIIPNTGSGGVETRDINGNCLNPPGVQFYYCPDPAFTSSCAINYLPDGCDARITAAQINAFEAELLCFAETLNPTGNWNCASICNISQMFQQWLVGSYQNSLLDKIQDHLCALPFVADITPLPLASYILCDGAGNLIRHVPASAIGCCPTSLLYDPNTDLLTMTLSVGGPLVTSIPVPLSTITNTVPGNQIGIHDDGEGNLTVLNETITTFTATVPGHLIGNYTNEVGAIVDVRETVTTITDDGAGTITYTDENGVNTIMTLPVANFFNTIPPGNQIGSFTDGVNPQIDVYETITAISLLGNTLSYDDEAGVTTNLILPVGAVAAVTNINPPGNLIATFNDGNGGPLVNINETITDLTLAGNTLTYTDEAGVANAVPLPVVTVTAPIVGNLIASVTNEVGTVFPINETITSISLLGNTLTYDDEAGVSTNIVLPVGAVGSITNTVPGNLIATFNDGNGGPLININETITTLTEAGNVLTYTDEAGVANAVPLPIIAVTNTIAGHRIATVTDEVGLAVDIDETITSLTILGNTLTYNDEDGIANAILLPVGAAPATITATIPGNQIAIFNDGNGGPNIPINETITTITNTNAGNQIADYTNEAGAVVPINETITSLTILGNTLTYNDEAGVANNVIIPADIVTTITNTNPGNQIADYTNELGVVVPINETITSISILGNTITYNDEAGAATNLVIPADIVTTITNTNVGNQIADYTNELGVVVPINETITTLALNIAGDLVYTSESGIPTIVNLPDCCMDSNLLQFTGGNNFRSTVTEGGVPFVSNLAVTLLGPCARPDRIIGINAGGALIQTELPPLDGGFVRAASTPSDMYTPLPQPNPAAPIGTNFDSNVFTVSVTNPSPCRSMNVVALYNYTFQDGLDGAGEVRFSWFEEVNGGGPVNISNSDFQRTLPPAVNFGWRTTIRTPVRSFVIAPSAVLTLDLFIRMTVTNPYAAGSTVNTVASSILVFGGNA